MNAIWKRRVELERQEMNQQWTPNLRIALSRCSSCGKAIERFHVFGPKVAWMATSKCDACRPIEESKNERA